MNTLRFQSLILLLTFASIFSALANADQIATQARIRESDGKKVFEYLDPSASSDQAKWIPFGEIEIKPKGTQFYHWGPENDVKHWVAHGISEQDIRNSADHVDHSDVEGGGFYVSLDPTDSSGFGPKQLIVQPEHDVTLLSGQFFFDSQNVGLRDTNNTLIPTPLLAKTGIEGIRYYNTWIVMIKASPLEALYDDPWLATVRSKNPASISSTQFMRLLTKFPISDSVQKSPFFIRTFPTFSKILNHQALSSSEQDEEAGKLYRELPENNSFALSPELRSHEFWESLLHELHLPLVKLYQSAYQSLSASKSNNENRYSEILDFISRLNLVQVSLPEVDPAFQSSFTLDYPPIDSGTSQANHNLLYSDTESPLLTNFSQKLFYNDFYPTLNQLIEDSQKPESPQADDDAWDNFHSLMNGGNESDPLARIADFLNHDSRQWRDFPYTEGGKYPLDGLDKPGYFLITDKQKKQLEAFPYIIPKFVPGPAEGQYYAQFETPSASNWKNFDKYLQNSPVYDELKEAEEQGKLVDPASAEFKHLTQALITVIIDLINSDFETNTPQFAQSVMRLHPFSNPDLNVNAVRAYAYAGGAWTPSLLPKLGLTSTFEEYQEAANATKIQAGNLRYLIKGSAGETDFDLDRAIGIWEVAADLPGHHQDSLAFIKAVKAKFLSPSVQGLIAQKKYEEVLRALHEAGAGL